MLLFVLFLGLVAQSWAAWAGSKVVRPPIMEEVPPLNQTRTAGRLILESQIEVPVDHFDPQNTDVFWMRYLFNEEFVRGPGAPIFILVGGHSDLQWSRISGGNVFELAYENNGYLAYLEHRYYGESSPFQDFTVENLRFLNVDQALADLAYFIRHLKREPRFEDSKVVLYGGFYAANMVVWFKQRYPHLATGVVASSAPLLAKVDFHEYLEIVHEAILLEGGEECIDILSQGIQDTVWALRTEEGRRLIDLDYRLCYPLNHTDAYEMGDFVGLITWTFSTMVQNARPGSIRSICDNFVLNFYGWTPMEQIGGFLAFTHGVPDCWNIDFENLLDNYRQTGNSRAWMYQLCTQFGYQHTAPRSGTAFDPLHWLSIDFYTEICKQAFTPEFDEVFIQKAADRVNEVFGGLKPSVNNTINVHGYIDPWRALGVHDADVTESSPTITVPRASHTFDMQAWDRTDTIAMTRAQQTVRRLVASWLAD